ncbi:Ankyrin repeat-containing domain protein [Naviculisporaceae sp. PSN 640]
MSLPTIPIMDPSASVSSQESDASEASESSDWESVNSYGYTKSEQFWIKKSGVPWDEHAPTPWESGKYTKEGAKAIHDAAIQADIPELTRLLEGGADVDTPDRQGSTWTPLLSVAYHFDSGPATREAYIAAARFLLEHGANVDACETGDQYLTPMHAVAASDEEAQDTPTDASGQEQGLEGLRAYIPLPIRPSPDYKLHFLQILISYGPCMKPSWGTSGQTALHFAIESRSSLAVINLLLTTDKNLLQAQDNYGRKPIHVAACNAHFEAVQFLLDSGANADEPVPLTRDKVEYIYTGKTPLLLACSDTGGRFKKPPRDDESSCRVIVDTLIRAGADIHATSLEGETALQLAAKTGWPSIIEVLRAAGMSSDPAALISKEADGATHPLIEAAARDHESLCRFLVQQDGADVNMTEPDGRTPLHAAAMSEHGDNADAIRELVALGADLEARIPSTGRTALHLATATMEFWGKPDSAAALLSLGADVKAVDNDGWTALHFAAWRHHLSVMEVLLEHGAQVGKTVVDGPKWKRADGREESVKGYTAADLAQTRRSNRVGAECVALLLSKGDRLSDDTKDLVEEDLLELDRW